MAQESKSAGKVFTVLRVLERNFAHGYSAGELAQATGFSPSDITRFVKTLEQAGYAERIPETNRIRPSIRYAQVATQIQHSLDNLMKRHSEITNRIYTGLFKDGTN